MSHKVHPKIFRIKEIADWDSRGFHKKNLVSFLKGDFIIREFLNKQLADMAVEKIEIERFPGKLNVIISSARPGLIIGRGGGGVEELKKSLLKILAKKLPVESTSLKKNIRIEIREIKDPWLSAGLSAQWVAQQLERRIPHKRTLKQALEKISAHKTVQGARIEMSGRLDGTEIARRAWLKKGRLPRQTLRADIDYSQTRAYCTYGVIGVKVWIYKGDKF